MLDAKVRLDVGVITVTVGIIVIIVSISISVISLLTTTVNIIFVITTFITLTSQPASCLSFIISKDGLRT